MRGGMGGTMTRVAALLRVSTVRQAKNHRDDEETLPVQRDSVRRFVASRDGWTLVREYAEEGVSAWSNSSEERDILQEVLADAKAGRFEVLVLFKYERLSRLSFEYTMLLYQLRRMGIRTWTVQDDAGGRELKVDSQTDKVLRFFEGWAAENESYNTSVRVAAKMRYMAQQGVWTGGKAPYGFRFRHGHGPSELPLEIDAQEATMVRLMFDLYLAEGLGSNRVAAKLNDLGYRQRNGNPWSDGTVRQVLRNPMMAGRPAYGRTYKDPLTHRHLHRPPGDAEVIVAPEAIEAWVLVPWDVWDSVQRRMSSYNRPLEPPDAAEDLSIRHSRSEASGHLLTGLLVCGSCGGKITGGYALPTHRCADGSLSRYRYPRYICRNQTGGRPCTGQRSYGGRKVDETVLEAVRGMLTRINSDEVFGLVRERVLQDNWQKTSRVELARRREERARKILREWTSRLNVFLSGQDSLYSEKFLAERAREAERDLEAATAQRTQAEERSATQGTKQERLEAFFRQAPSFWQRFMTAELHEQKRLLGQLLGKIVLSREGVEIHWKVDLDQLSGSAGAGDVEWREGRGWVSTS